MMTIAQAFQQFLQDLELRPAERDEASRQHTNLRQQLQKKLDVEDNFLSGSYARRTAIRPLNDIDVFLVLEATAELSTASAPQRVLQVVKSTLEAIYPGKSATLQSRSVNIEFSGTGIAYDVVPAFSAGDEVYKIPDCDAPKWIKTNPKIHRELSVEANERAGDKLKPLVKAVKHANNVHAGGARSFHLEALAWKILTSPPESNLAGLRILLDGLVARICDPCPDPAGLGADIRPSTVKCQQAQAWLRKMATLAEEAETLAADGRTGEAHARMRELFGKVWPEEGTPGGRGRGGPVIVGAGAVDHSSSRFG